MNADSLTSDELWGVPGLRVALVTETYPPEINGVAMTLGQMVEGLIARGYRIQLIRPRQPRDESCCDTDELRELLTRGWKIPRYDGLNFGLPSKGVLVNIWRRQRPDLVHVATEGPLGWSAVSAARKLRIPVTSDFHTNFDHYSRHYGAGWLRKPVSAYLKRFHNRTERTFVPTLAMAQGLVAQGYRSVSVVARGVDAELFDSSRRDDSLRRCWGVDDSSPVVLYVGRLAPEKNLQLLVRAFRAIRAECAGARCVVVGDGPARKTLEQELLEVHFAGIRRDEDLARHYASADIFLFPSLTETYGNVTLEALSSGLCVVAFDYAAAADVIRDGENGLLARNADEQAFLSAAVAAATRPELRQRIRVQARAGARALSWDAVNDRFSHALLDVWERCRRRDDEACHVGRGVS